MNQEDQTKRKNKTFIDDIGGFQNPLTYKNVYVSPKPNKIPITLSGDDLLNTGSHEEFMSKMSSPREK